VGPHHGDINLAPSHESQLVNLLARVTQMTVLQIKNGVVIKPNVAR